MIFYLKYTKHHVEKLHELIDFFFDYVEKHNPINFDFSTQFPLWYSTPPIYRMRKIEALLNVFTHFDRVVQDEIIQAFKDSHDIQKLFADESKQIRLGRYFEKYPWKSVTVKKKTVHFTVSNFLSELFSSLYTDQLGNKESVFSKKIKSNLSSHYTSFAEENRVDFVRNLVCPCCGLEKIRDEINIRKPDHDHLLPKGDSLYVFSTVNLRNLLPSGTECNIVKDVANLLYTDAALKHRTSAFYPYDVAPHPFQLFEISLSCNEFPNSANLYKGQWTVSIEPKNNADFDTKKKIESWDRVFKIKARLEKFIEDSNKALIDREFKITRIKDVDTLKTKLQNEFESLKLDYFFLTTHVELIPKRIFYQWALNNPNYLSGHVMLNSITTKVDLDF